jgi:hypothetical protein
MAHRPGLAYVRGIRLIVHCEFVDHPMLAAQDFARESAPSRRLRAPIGVGILQLEVEQ